MPELPHLMVYERRVRDAAAGRHVEHLETRDEAVIADLEPGELRRRVEGSGLSDVRRHGKLLFVRLGDDGWLRFHFGMTGFLRHVADADDEPDHTHVLFRLDDGTALAFSCQRKLGEVGWVDDPDRHVEEKDLGPDPLSEGFGGDDFLEALEGRRGMVKSGLMNQSALAGIGNEYSDEILFRVGLHPRTDLPPLEEADRLELWEATRDVLRTAARAEADPDRLPEGWLLRARFTGDDERCPRCGTEIERVRVSGRNARFCPECQPAP